MKSSEASLQKSVIEYLNLRKDIYFIRNNNFSGMVKRKNGSCGWIKNVKKGAPDLILLFKSRWIGLELKSQKGKQSIEQRQAEIDIKQAGGEYYIIRDLKELNNIL